jgi:hypothetical protein
MKLSIYLTLKRNQNLYDCATGTGTDNTIDPTASAVNPSKYLVGQVSGISRVIIPIMLVVFLSVASVYYFKQIKNS